MAQVPLALALNDFATFENFHAENDGQIIQQLKKFISEAHQHCFYIYGASGSGRSHLLQASCHTAMQQNQSVFYLSLADVENLSVDILLNLEQVDLIALDDIHCIVGNKTWEEAVFHCYNRTRDMQTKLIVAADAPPRQLAYRLPDLQSRFTWGLIFQLPLLDDLAMIAALKMRAKNRGMLLSDEVAIYLLNHYPRNMRDLIALLEILEKKSLIEQRRLTVPFVKQVLLSYRDLIAVSMRNSN